MLVVESSFFGKNPSKRSGCKSLVHLAIERISGKAEGVNRAMNLDEIIESFKVRVNKLTQDWDAVTSTSLHTLDDELKLLKAKLDLVQEQNSAIIVDLDHIKKVLNLDDDASNNVFTLLNTPGDGLGDAANIAANAVAAATLDSQQHSPNTPQSETSSHHPHHLPTHALDVSSISSLATSLDADLHPLKKRRMSLTLKGEKETRGEHTLPIGNGPAIRRGSCASGTSASVANTDVAANGVEDADGTAVGSHGGSHHENHQSSRDLVNDENRDDVDLNDDDADQRTIANHALKANKPRAAGYLHMRTNGESSASTHHHLARRQLPAVHLQEIEDYELQMVDNPKSVAELYAEFDNSLKMQIMDFEKRFGKGQLSRIPKIRTYQRRRALVSEIDKYARFTNKSTEDAIQFFESIRNEKNKSVAWLYNNLGRVLAEYL